MKALIAVSNLQTCRMLTLSLSYRSNLIDHEQKPQLQIQAVAAMGANLPSDHGTNEEQTDNARSGEANQTTQAG